MISSTIQPDTIDWSRMAVPQDDGYDSEVTLMLAEAGTAGRPPYRRRPADGAALLFDGIVSVREAPPNGLMNERIVPAPVDHPNLTAAAGNLARWPAACAQFKRLTDTIYPYTDPAESGHAAAWTLGSSSHSYEEEFGAVHVTVDCPLGLAQALIHEMAHHKLRALGVSVESAGRLIANHPDQRFASPVRKDKLRPMTAVFHAQYSFIHMTALDLHMLAAEPDEGNQRRIMMLLARNVPRMEAGFTEIDRSIETDDAGRRFVQAFMDWSRRVLDEGRRQLDAGGYGLAPIS
jgi:HEXXH motif-containing protein